MFGSDLGNCGGKGIELPSIISVAVKLEGNQVSWKGEWVEIYFQNWHWSAGAPWDFVHCNLSGDEFHLNKTQLTASCALPKKYDPGLRDNII